MLTRPSHYMDVRRALSPLDAPVPVKLAGGAYAKQARPGSTWKRASWGRSTDVPLLRRLRSAGVTSRSRGLSISGRAERALPPPPMQRPLFGVGESHNPGAVKVRIAVLAARPLGSARAALAVCRRVILARPVLSRSNR